MDQSEDRLAAAQSRIARSAALWLGAYVACSTGIYTAIDVWYYDSDAAYLISAFVVWFLGYLLLVGLMRASHPDRLSGAGGIGGYFALCFIAGIAIGFAYLLLIIPGIYLTMRWLPAYAREQATGEGVTQALEWSWQQTAPHQRALAIAMAPPVGLIFLAFGMMAYQSMTAEPLEIGVLYAGYFLINLALAVSGAWTQLLGVAVLRQVEEKQAEPYEVFA